MGGFGSGGQNRKWQSIDDYRRLDAFYLHRHDLLRDGTQTIIRWSSKTGNSAAVRLSSDGAMVTLRYQSQPDGELEWTVIEDAFKITRIPKPFGGCQAYLCCRHCAKRCRYLFVKGSHFACRTCHGLAHATRQASKSERATLKNQSLRERLGSPLGLGDPVLRPKGMHAQTFQRYQARIQAAECEVWDQAVGLLKRLQAFDESGGLWPDRERFWG